MYYLSLLTFLDKGFKFPPSVCNGCHDVLKMSTNIKNIAILNDHGVDSRCIFVEISRNEARNIFKNSDLSK